MQWIKNFQRDILIKKAIVISGIINDIYTYEKLNGEYFNLLNIIKKILQDNKYEVISWDNIKGVDASSEIVSSLESSLQLENKQSSRNNQGNNYLDDEELDNIQEPISSYQEPEQFFSLIYPQLSKNGNKAFIIDFSNYIFSNPNQMAENQRKWATIFAKAIRDTEYNVNEKANIVIFIDPKSIIQQIFLKNPLVSSISIPTPNRKDRKEFIDSFVNQFFFDKELEENEIDNLIDLLDGMLLRDIHQLIKLSNQQEEKLTPTKLINFYKYGIVSSPWEELSKNKISKIRDILIKRVKGQDRAVEKVESVVKKAFTGLSGMIYSTKAQKPKGVLFFVGPTGVGKTELAKSLAEFLFGDEEACLRFDMSEYNHEHSDQRLVGAPPGYVGYENGGQLTNAVKEKPFSVLLFDEIEKAHGKILDKFLQILEDGRLTDGKGETISFNNTIIIFTSNIGASDDSEDKLSMSEHELELIFKKKVKIHFQKELGRPELLNRIGEDNIVVFNYIKDDDVMIKIAKSKLSPIFEAIKEKYRCSVKFENEDKALRTIVSRVNKEFGGRGILNKLEECIIDGLSDFIFENRDDLGVGVTILISQIANKAKFDFELE